MSYTGDARACLLRIEELLERLVVLQGGVIQEPEQLPAEVDPSDRQEDPASDDTGQDAEER